MNFLFIRPLQLPLTSTSKPTRDTLKCQLQPTQRLIALPSGLQMEVIQQSPNPLTSTNPPLVFIHGSCHAAWCFDKFSSYFSRHGFATHAISVRNAGQSQSDSESDNTPSLEEHYADISAFMAQLTPSIPPIIIAHSMGGFIVQKWLESSSFQPSALVLMASTPPSGNGGIAWRRTKRKGLIDATRITVAFVRRAVGTDLEVCRQMFFWSKDKREFREDIEGDEVLLKYMEMFKTSKPSLGASAFSKKVSKVPDLGGKVLVIGGSEDVLVDVEALEETAQLWGADLQVLEGMPHDLMLFSQWEYVAASILEWIKTKLTIAETQAVAAR